jgi:antitoxin component YwqK of YwqJK toxin-antitoxin module
MESSEPLVDGEDLDFEQGWAMYKGLLFTGVAFERGSNGALYWEMPYRDGYAHGTEREWYPSGRLKSQREIVAGVVHGMACEWAEDGRLVIEAVYEYGRLLERKRHAR